MKNIKILINSVAISLLFMTLILTFPCHAEQLRYSDHPDSPIPFAFEKEDLETFLKLDEDTMKILVQQGKIIMLEPGTKYTLIESGFLSLGSKVMIASGAFKGRKGYVSSSARDVMSELTGKETGFDNKTEVNRGREASISIKEWQPVENYLKQVNSITIGFGEKLKDNLQEFNLASKNNESKRINEIYSRMNEMIKQYRAQLESISVPENCKDIHSLHEKKFDIVEKLWVATMGRDKERIQESRNQLSENAYELNTRLEQILRHFENQDNDK